VPGNRHVYARPASTLTFEGDVTATGFLARVAVVRIGGMVIEFSLVGDPDALRRHHRTFARLLGSFQPAEPESATGAVGPARGVLGDR